MAKLKTISAHAARLYNIFLRAARKGAGAPPPLVIKYRSFVALATRATSRCQTDKGRPTTEERTARAYFELFSTFGAYVLDECVRAQERGYRRGRIDGAKLQRATSRAITRAKVASK